MLKRGEEWLVAEFGTNRNDLSDDVRQQTVLPTRRRSRRVGNTPTFTPLQRDRCDLIRTALAGWDKMYGLRLFFQKGLFRYFENHGRFIVF